MFDRAAICAAVKTYKVRAFSRNTDMPCKCAHSSAIRSRLSLWQLIMDVPDLSADFLLWAV